MREIHLHKNSDTLSTNDTPYVLYQDFDLNRRLTVKKYNGSNWVTVGNAGFTSIDNSTFSLALSPSEVPYVAFKETTNANKICVMQFNGSVWVNVGTPGFTDGSYNAITISPNNEPYVFSGNGSVWKYNGTVWVSLGAVSTGNTYTSLAFSKQNVLYAAYTDTSGNGYKATVKKYNGSSWVTVGTAALSSGSAKYIRIAFFDSGDPVVLFADGANGDKPSVMLYK